MNIADVDEDGFLCISGESMDAYTSEEAVAAENPDEILASSSFATTTTTTSNSCRPRPKPKGFNEELERQIFNYLTPKARKEREAAKRKRTRERARAEAKRQKTKKDSCDSRSSDSSSSGEDITEYQDEDPGPSLHEAATNRMPHRHRQHVTRSGRVSKRTKRFSEEQDFDFQEEVQSQNSPRSRRSGSSEVCDSAAEEGVVVEEEEEEDEGDTEMLANVVEYVKTTLGRLLPPNVNKQNELVDRIASILVNPDDVMVQGHEDAVTVPPHLTEMNRTRRPAAPVTVSEIWTSCVDPDMSEVYRVLGNPSDRTACWGCKKIGRGGALSDCNAWNQMVRLYHENLDRMKPIELAQQLHNYFEKAIRGPANRNRGSNEPVPEWKAVDILMHMTRHNNDPVSRSRLMIGQVNNMMDTLYEYGMYKRNKTFNWMVVPKSSAIKDYANLVKIIQMLYKSSPERMFGASQDSALASSAAVTSWINPDKPSFGNKRSHPGRPHEASA